MANPSEDVFPYDYKVETLDNGLKVILVPMSSSKGLVSYYSIVRTGSRDEYEPGHSGFAHFFEHMMFRGTKKYPGSVYDKLITEMGADGNAYTTDDYTAYHLSFATEDLEKIIELESDRFQNLSYKKPEFQTEAGAVYGEYRKNVTNPWMVMFEKLQETAFDKHTYRHTTMGFVEDIKAMPTMYEYSLSFFDRYYRPENVVLLISGDIDEKSTMDMINKYYGGWEKGYVTPQIPEEPPQTGPRMASVKYEGKSLPLLFVAYKGDDFDPSDKEAMAGLLLGDLAFGSNSDLYKKLVLEEQKVQMFGEEFGVNRDPGLWMIYSMIKKTEDVAYVQEEIASTVQQFQEAPVDAKKLENLKKRRKYDFLMNLDTPDKVGGNLARIVAVTGGIEAVDKMFATIAEITPADIQAAAKKYLDVNRRTTITLEGRK